MPKTKRTVPRSAKNYQSTAPADPPRLSPSQQQAYAQLEKSLHFGRLLVVWGGSGMGKTTILRHLWANRFPDAPFLSTRDFLQVMLDRHPLALEEAYTTMVAKAMAKNEVVLVDDFHLLNDAICCGYNYPRKNYFQGPLTALLDEAASTKRLLVFGNEGSAPTPIANRCYYAGVKQLLTEDYRHICSAWLPAQPAGKLDFAKIHRFAPRLNGHQLRGACQELALDSALDTGRFIDYLRARRMASNVDLAEVQPVDLKSLKGLDDVIESLEANVVLPFENDKLAEELKIRPKRGVLIIGPPGTGKTTVGRALAHRLKSKFFLIDGTFISGTQAFYPRVQRVVEAAKQNAPSIIFIDDSDVMFETGKEQGLYRYLLTLLDGIESESSGTVCVMMTAMDVSGLPPALIRSGRVELWLETRLPDEAARAAILFELIAGLPEGIPAPDLSQLAAATQGLTGADLKRLVEDGKLLFAFDRAQARTLQSSTDYMLKAMEGVRGNKERYAKAEAKARENTRSVVPQEQYFPPDSDEADDPA
jgi:transitional endoplasmic reticulum ATPase